MKRERALEVGIVISCMFVLFQKNFASSVLDDMAMGRLDPQHFILAALEAQGEDSEDLMSTGGDMMIDDDMMIDGTGMMTGDETDMMTVGETDMMIVSGMNRIHDEDDIMNLKDHLIEIAGTNLRNAELKLPNGMQKQHDDSSYCKDHHAYIAANMDVSNARRAILSLTKFLFLDPAKSLNRKVPASCVRA